MTILFLMIYVAPFHYNLAFGFPPKQYGINHVRPAHSKFHLRATLPSSPVDNNFTSSSCVHFNLFIIMLIIVRLSCCIASTIPTKNSVYVDHCGFSGRNHILTPRGSFREENSSQTASNFVLENHSPIYVSNTEDFLL